MSFSEVPTANVSVSRVDSLSLVRIERWVSIAIGAVAASGFVWAMNPRAVATGEVVIFVASMPLWAPLVAAIVQAPVWMSRWVNRRTDAGPKLRLQELPGSLPPKGRYLFMDANLQEPIEAPLILLRVRQICASSAIIALASATILFGCWWTLQRPWLCATGCIFAGVLAWEIYPRSGIRYRTGIFMRQSLIRDLCMVAFGKGFQESTPIRQWHHSYFDVLQEGPYESDQESKALLWLHLYALSKGDIETARSRLERHLALPMQGAVEQYVGLGNAVYFYTVVVPDRNRSNLLIKRLRAVKWDLPLYIEYIEASIALAEGRRSDALSLAQAHLDRLGPEAGSARTQLQRELLSTCCIRAMGAGSSETFQ